MCIALWFDSTLVMRKLCYKKGKSEGFETGKLVTELGEAEFHSGAAV